MTQTIQLSEQQIKHRERRAKLRQLSDEARERIEDDCEGMTVNEVLIQEFYSDENNTEFKTLWQWSKDGFKVNKGSIAFVVWGKPQPIKKGQENAQNDATEEEESDFYPLCYLFSNAQVTKK